MDSQKARVEGEFLVIPSKTALPERCAHTNTEITGRDYQVWDLPCIPKWLIVFMLLSPFLLLFLPFISLRRCKFKAGLSKQVRRRYLLRKILGGVVVFGSIAIVPLAIAMQSELWILLSMTFFVPGFWLGFAILILFSSPLRVVQERDRLFWIKGCGSDFLNSLS